MKNEKILVLSPFFYPHIGGSQRYMEEVAVNIAKKHASCAIDVLCYNTARTKPQEKYRGLNIHRISCFEPVKGQFALPNPLSLIWKLIQLSKNNYLAIYVNTRFFDVAWWGWILARIWRAKSVLTDHVASHPVHENKFIEMTAKIIDKTLTKFSLNQYDAITVTNSETYNFLVNKIKITAPVIISFGGVDTGFYKTYKRLRRVVPNVDHEFAKHDTVITFSGRLIKTKGIEYFLNTIKSQIKNLPRNVYFIVAGRGNLEKYVAKEIVKNNLSKRVYFTGALANGQVKKLLQATDIFVHPSTHSEGFPNAILEAGACGCFVIATDNAGTDEIIINKKTGLLIPQGSQIALTRAIKWSMSNTRKRNKMSLNLRRYIKTNFRWIELSEEMHKFLFKRYRYQGIPLPKLKLST